MNNDNKSIVNLFDNENDVTNFSELEAEVSSFATRHNLKVGSAAYFDSVTYFYKSFLDALPSCESCIVYLMIKHGFMQTADISRKMRESSKYISAIMQRLIKRGVVKVAYRCGKDNIYSITSSSMAGWMMFRQGWVKPAF